MSVDIKKIFSCCPTFSDIKSFVIKYNFVLLRNLRYHLFKYLKMEYND